MVHQPLYQSVSLKKMLPNTFLHRYKKIVIPELSTKGYKGCYGKICVIGGSALYSGAPYFAAMTTLKIGAELCFVLTTKECAKCLKCYSPDLIVYPFLYSDKTKETEKEMNEFEKSVAYLSKKVDAAIIGPGLGSVDQTTTKCLHLVIKEFIKNNVSLVFDADAIQFVIKNNELFNLIQNYPNSIFTPNKNEFLKLLQHFSPKFVENAKTMDINTIIHGAHILKEYMKEANILVKGFYDVFISNHFFFVSFLPNAAPKRVGGLGDILAGAVGTFQCWKSKVKEKNISNLIEEIEFNNGLNEKDMKSIEQEILYAIAAFNGSFFLKSVCIEAFKIKHRGLLASDVMNLTPEVFYELYEIKEYDRIKIITEESMKC